MANTLGYYNPVFYANEALRLLYENLGMARYVYRGYENERRSFGRGEYINIRRPGTFSAGDAPAAATAIASESVQIQLAYWREVKFELTDKELAFTGEQIIRDHIAPAAHALAVDIDTKLASLYQEVPWYVDGGTAITVALIAQIKRVMATNKVPLDSRYFMLDEFFEEEMVKIGDFNRYDGGGAAGVNMQLSGLMGRKFGYDFFMNQNVPTHTPGVCADVAGAVDLVAGYDAGDTTVHIDAVTDGGTATAGDILSITGDTQKYAITTGVTFTGGEGDCVISPALKQAVLDNAVVGIDITAAGPQNMAFHKNAFALVVAPLPDLGGELGTRMATVTDPTTGLSLRSRLFYEPNSSAINVALDVLYGVKTLDPNMAVRLPGDGA